ncbi:MAG: tetratricopeptide repeat protein [Bacteroidota bacterium]
MMPLGNSKLTNFLLIIALFLLAACSKQKDTLPARVYHSTTSYFNWYYNAQVLYNETVKRLEEQYKFPEQGFMQIAYEGTEAEIQGFKSDFENINKKNDAVLFKHPNGNYVDDCRLLNGKSWYYRKNYPVAMQNFEAVQDSFPETELMAESWLWIAKTFHKMENFQMAKNILQEQILGNDTLVITDDLAADIALFRTELAIENEEFPSAIRYLSDNIFLIKGRMRQARSHFLLGQLYAEIDNFPKAMEQFSMVEKVSLDYELSFLSKISIARLFVEFQEGQDDDQEVFNYLTKLLKDEKNIEYQDRIYYEFALLDLKQKDVPGALENLNLSVRVSQGNQRQKGLSYFKSGQLYFYELQDYPSAQLYYDSAATSINKDAPEYDEINKLASTLKDYITQLETIQYQDSMLYLASLPQAQLDSIVNILVEAEKKRKEEELAAQLAEMQSQNFNGDPRFNPQLQQMERNRNRNSGSGTWYFDNPNAMSSGRMQFQQIWGQRGNEDDWRRSKKVTMAFAPGTPQNPKDPGQGQAQEAEAVDSTLLKQYGDKYNYYKDIPKTDEEKEIALAQIEEAMFKLGQIYYQKLEEPDSAIALFERLLDRFEGSEFTLQARYALYQLYTDQKSRLANVQRSVILAEFPNTVYAYLILGKDPNELRKDEEDYKFAYNGLFNAYAQKQYETSLGFSEFLLAQEQFHDKPDIDMARLQYIRGMSYGYVGQKDSLETILSYVVKVYPEHEVTPVAKKTLEYLRNGIPDKTQPAAAATPKPTASPELVDAQNAMYKGFTDQVKPTDKIFVLVYIDKNQISKTEANNIFNNFNKATFANKKLKTFTFLYKQTHILPYISNFKTVDEAKAYIQAFRTSAEASKIFKSNDEKMFYISHTNFKVAYGQKRMTDYIKYFENILSK